MAAARAAFPGWRDTPREDRNALIERMGDALIEHRQELAELLVQEQAGMLTKRILKRFVGTLITLKCSTRTLNLCCLLLSNCLKKVNSKPLYQNIPTC